MSQKEFLSSRLEEAALTASRRMMYIFTDFYEPNLQHIIEREIGRYPESDCTFFGGTEYTERKMLCVHPKGDAPSQDDFPVDCVQAVLPKNASVSHPDVLGAVLGAGIERDKVGDITVRDGLIQVFVASPLGQFICENVTSVSRWDVDMKLAGKDDIVSYEPVFTEVSVIIPSMRIDAVIHAVYRLSRSEAAAFVKGEKVFIDHEPVTKPGRDVKAGDIISVRSKGRFIVESLDGSTKKGNLKITVKRFS